MSTAAFLSKRITDPSGRRMSLAVRTTTAFMTSPFFTRPRGIASLTDTTMMSPTEAYLRFEPPRTLMHMTRRAPELSETSRFVCIWIMALILSLFQTGFRLSRTTPDGDLASPALVIAPMRREPRRARQTQGQRALPSSSGKTPLSTGRLRDSTLFRESNQGLDLVDQARAFARPALNESPGLELRIRPRLLDRHDVADFGRIVLVVGVIVFRLPHRLFHDRMREAPLDLHDDGLVLFVADDDALQLPLRHVEFLLSLGFAKLLAKLLALHRPHPSDVLADLAHARSVLKLARRALKAQVELLFFQVQQFVPQLVGRHGLEVGEPLVRLHRSLLTRRCAG